MGCVKDILLVCEDDAHNAFVYQCMKTMGVKNLKWHIDKYTASRVRAHHGNRAEVIDRLKDTEYCAWRQRNAKCKVLLVAVIDADEDEINCAKQSLGASDWMADYSHLFVHIIPKRNIQTWVKLAESCSSDVPNESEDYKTTGIRSAAKSRDAAKKLTKIFMDKIANNGVNIPFEANPVWMTFFTQMEELRKALKVKPWI